jgi:hypothetical protein
MMQLLGVVVDGSFLGTIRLAGYAGCMLSAQLTPLACGIRQALVPGEA